MDCPFRSILWENGVDTPTNPQNSQLEIDAGRLAMFSKKMKSSEIAKMSHLSFDFYQRSSGRKTLPYQNDDEMASSSNDSNDLKITTISLNTVRFVRGTFRKYW